MSWYKTGTVAVTNGSTLVTGTGTAWVASAQPGEEFRLEGALRGYEIVAVVSNTELTITPAYLDTTQSGQSYSFPPYKGFLQRAYDALTAGIDTIDAHINGALSGRFAAGSEGAPGVVGSSDTDTGLWWKASDQLAAVTGGVQRWLLSSTAMQIDVPTDINGPIRSTGWVGTCASSGLSPIIQRGSTGDGEFLRLADGTQWCWSPDLLGTTDVSTGAIYRSGNMTWNYPAEFIAEPNVHGSCPGEQSTWAAIKPSATGNTSSAVMRGLASASGIERRYRAIAVGRWHNN